MTGNTEMNLNTVTPSLRDQEEAAFLETMSQQIEMAWHHMANGTVTEQTHNRHVPLVKQTTASV